MPTVPIFDTTGANVARMPAGQAAGYVTGSGGVPWTPADWAAHPGAVRIDQTPTPGAWDGLADVQDYENGAVQLAEVAPRAKAMLAAYHAAARPGQRVPAIYVGARPNATPVCNALEAAGVTGGVCLAIAAPGMTDADAVALIEQTAATPWPVVWVQNGFHGAYDSGHASVHWLEAVSVAPRRLAAVSVLFTSGPPAVFHA